MGFWRKLQSFAIVHQQELLKSRGYKATQSSDLGDCHRFLHFSRIRVTGCSILRDKLRPDAMIAELKKMGIELMVSFWPTVDNPY